LSPPKRILLLVASPRGFQSTFNSLGSYLIQKLGEGGFETQKLHVQASMRTQKTQQAMLEMVGASDLLILAFPLYIDSLPAQLIAALEKIAEQRKNSVAQKTQGLVAIVNNGFPESNQNMTALAICRQFALEAGIEWVGGLSLGGGGVLDGGSVEEAGFVARNIRKALDFAAKDLLDGNPVSKQAVESMAKPSIPRWLYLWVSNRGWKKQAKACGAEKKLYNKV
jgi:multimeric flavodoxin WrbA